MQPLMRVLLADDHPAFLAEIERELGALPHLAVVGYAQSGKETLEQVAQIKPDLVLLDIAMPDMNGLEVARRIKAQASAIVVVLVSLYNTPVYRSASMSLADGFVAKDMLDIELMPLIRRLFPGPDHTGQAQ